MSDARSPAPFLALQTGAILVITSAVLAMWWVERRTFAYEVDDPRRVSRELRIAASEVTTAPYAYVSSVYLDRQRECSSALRACEARLPPEPTTASPDDQRLPKARKAIETARIKLALIKETVPEAGRDVDQAMVAIDQVETTLGLMVRSSPTTDLSKAFPEVDNASRKLTGAIARIEATVAARADTHFTSAMQNLMVAWGAALVIVLMTGLVARRRYITGERIQSRTNRRAIAGVKDVLQAALDGKDSAPELAAVPEFAGLNEAASRTFQGLSELRAKVTRLQRSTSFIQDLQDTLIVAETEEEVLAAITRAARVAYPDCGFRVLMLDPATNQATVHGGDNNGAVLDGARKDPAVQKGRTVTFRGEEGVPRGPWAPGGEKDSGSPYTSAPVAVNGHVVALLQLFRYQPDQVHFEELEAMALAMGARLGVARSLAQRELEAGTDPLTGLPNRRILNDRLASLDEADLPYGIVIADLDRFKDLNDRFGHEVGDRCLQTFANVLREACRESDLPCRMGGEEFVIVLPNVGVKASLAVAMRVREYLYDAVAHLDHAFTVSLGVAARPEHGRTSEAVLRAADTAMYEAKEAGRDQVVPARILPSNEAV
jgi:diguanylate cyclase (GGDEF)-like protein